MLKKICPKLSFIISGIFFLVSLSVTCHAEDTSVKLSSTTNDFPLGSNILKLSEPLSKISKFDSIYGKYISGKGYFLSARENVGLRLFWNRVNEEVMRVRISEAKERVKTIESKSKSPIDSQQLDFKVVLDVGPVSKNEILSAAIAVIRLDSENKRKTKTYPGFVAKEEMMFVSIPTPSAVTLALAGIEMMLDDILNRVNSGVSSALFAMRSHVAASEADLNVIFKNRLDEAFDRLDEQEQKILTNATVLAAQAERTIKEVEKDGFEHAADLVCETTAGFANYSLGLPIGRLIPPDLLCLTQLDIRDVGPQHEQLLTFRGVHLQPGEEYPMAKISVAGQELQAITGGGDSVLQMPLQGGINGEPNDTSLRGDRVAQAELSWSKSGRVRRWLFMLKPYLVRSIDVVLTPSIKGPVRKIKTQTCSVGVHGGTLGSREEYATCTILADDDWEIESCSDSYPSTANGDAGIRNRLQSVGACQWELSAKSGAFWGGGAWYQFEGHAMLKQNTVIKGKPYEERAILNHGDTGKVFRYPIDYVPAEYQIEQGNWTWEINYSDNTGRKHTLTNSQATDTEIGTGSMSNGELTFTAGNTFIKNLDSLSNVSVSKPSSPTVTQIK